MNKRYYCVELILYTDNANHIRLLETLCNKYHYAFILHDKDKNDDGTLKKEHYHLLLFFDNARWGSAILKEIEIDNTNLIEFRDNKAEAIRYLIHSNNLDKYQYDFNDIQSDVDISMYFNNLKNKESSDIAIIFDYISNYVGIIYFHQLYSYVLANNLWSTYRRNYSIIKDLMNEHNYQFGIVTKY